MIVRTFMNDANHVGDEISNVLAVRVAQVTSSIEDQQKSVDLYNSLKNII